MKQHIQLGLLVLTILTLAYFVVNLGAPVHAKSQEPGCKPFAVVGTVEIDHCVTDSGFEFIANSAGFMAVEP